jgi:PiT family inorganic phosphate transporter
MVGVGVTAVQWGKVGSIAASWVVSPLLAGTIAFGLFRSVQRLILDAEDPFRAAKRFVPMYIFLVGFIIALVTLLKGLKHIGMDISLGESYLLAAGAGLTTMAIGAIAVRRIHLQAGADRDFSYTNVERVFAVLMIFTACAMAFAHGSNDVANAIGPVAAIVGVVQSGGEVAQESALPLWVLVVGAVGIIAGLATYGYRVMAVIGDRITELTPSRGFAATLAAATTVVAASGTGLPISTTHTLVGAVLGVGMARGIAAINMRVVQNIFMSWIVTLPAGAILSMLFFVVLKGLLGQ